MSRWLRARASILSFASLIAGLSGTPHDEVWLLQFPEVKVRSVPSERRDFLEVLGSTELQHSLGLANPSLSRFWRPDSSVGPPVPWFYSHLFDEPPFGNQVPMSSRPSDVAPPSFTEFQAENDRSRERLRQRTGPVTWPLTNNAPDENGYGQILEKIIVNPVSDPVVFAFRTLHGKHLEVGSNKSVFANGSETINSHMLFWLMPLPTSPNLVFWGSPTEGCCVKAEPSGGLVMEDTVAPVKKNVFEVVAEEENYIVLKSMYGRIDAGLDKQLTTDWRSETYANYPYELGEHLEQKMGKVVVPLGRTHGAISGFVVLWLCCLAAFNIHFALSSKTGAASATRLPSFDVVRFVLETLVLHVHIGGLGLYDGQAALYLTAFRMPAFVFTAGMFGSSMAYQSVSKLLCCTLGTTAIVAGARLLQMCIIHSPHEAWKSLFHLNLSELCGDFWFLIMLAFCRIFVTPIFYFAKTYLGLRPLGPFLVTKLVSYFLLHKAAQWKGSIFGQYNLHTCLVFMPYFAVGLLMTPAEWDTFMRRFRVKLACFFYFALWYLMQMVPAFLKWNRQYCLPMKQKVGCRAHFDVMQILEPINLELFATDFVLFGLRSGITISFVCMVVSLSQLIEPVLPRLTQLMAGWGSRTLYAYVLQQYLLFLLKYEGRFFNHLRDTPPAFGIVLELVVPVTANIILSSQGTEYWFRWALLPYWMKDLFEKYIFSYPEWAEARAKLETEANAKAAL